MVTVKLRAILLGVFFVLLAAGGDARAAEFWTQYVDTQNCAVSRGGWLSVAKESPGFGWQEVPGSRPSENFSDAIAWMDNLRLSSALFRTYCCWASVYRDPQNDQRAAVMGRLVGMPPDPPAGALQLELLKAPCCEDAALAIGADPMGCTTVALQSVPGATVIITPSGPSAVGGPITLPTNPPIVVASISTALQAGTYLGCYKDPNNPFNLDGYLERSAQNTPQRCVEICRQRGFAYAGVEYGESCLCGDSYAQFGTASNCDMTCTGDAGQTCGGMNANSVYATGL